MSTEAALVESLIATVPDFPEPGIVFRDLTPVFASGPALQALGRSLTDPFEGRFDAIAGLEARGFLIAGAAAALTGAGVLTVRKAGKLPRTTLRAEYRLEYGSAAFEIHAGELAPGTRVLIVDDVLATGGTVAASADLIERAGWQVAGIAVALELTALGGRSRVADYETFSLLAY